MAQKIIHWLLIALILSLGFGQLLRFETSFGAFYLHDLLVICILSLRGRTLKVPLSLKIFTVGLGLGWLRALTLYPLHDLLIPSLYSLRLLAYVALYLTLRSQKIKIPRNIFIISGLVCCFIGLLQYFLMPDMRVFQYLGWDDHLSRLTLPHFDPTFTAVMLVLTLLSLSLVHWYIGILFGLAILLTYSRSVWLSLALTGVYFVRNKKILCIAGVLLLLCIFALPQKFGEGTNLLRTYSISSRITSDVTIVKDLRWNLVVGQGMNTFALSSVSEKGYPNHATSPNNSYLYLLATTGIIGLVGFLLFIRDLYLKSTYKPMIIFILIASLFNNVLFYPFALLWVLLIQNTTTKEDQLLR